MVRQKTDLRIHEEISVLQKKLSETDIQLTEEKKTQVRLTNEANTKVKELNLVLQAISDEEKAFADEVRSMTQDTERVERDNKKRLKELTAERTALEHHISAMDTLERENDYLRTQIIKLTKEHNENTLFREEEREKIKQRNFDSRMTMEGVLRKEIQTLDTNFKVLAIQSMNDEAMMASNENKGLYAELSRREDVSRNMISEQQASYEEVQRITIEHEVMITAADYYENIINSLNKVVKRQESKEKKLKFDKDKLQDTVQTFETICSDKYTQADYVLELYKKYETLKEKNSRSRKECIKTCQRALRLAITRATEQASAEGKELSKDEEARALEEEKEREAAKAELLNISSLLAKSTSLPLSSSQEVSARSVPSDYDAMWQSSAVKFPQLTGTIRTAVLSDDRHRHSYTFGKKKSKKLLVPKGASASMTNHI
mmetsp:Transcript_16326/g.30476  ORF Transcript_16326/g.30476 Transcript_16326/m.30476 type:complete len:432 (-) Transcript_16326:167-1462(-)